MPREPSQTPTTETRKLAAIMFTDIVGFSRQMGADETRMLRLLDVHNQIIQQAVSAHHGHIIKTIGDAFLVDFPSVVNAVQCAQAIQAQFRTHNAEKEPTEQIHVRIGIHLGDIVQKDGDVFGDGVNIAARLQALAEPDTICISDMVYRDVAKKLDLGTLVWAGRAEDGIGLIEQGMRLDPRNPAFYLQRLGWAYRVAGRCEESIAALKQVLSLTPAFIPSRVNLVVCYVELGREEEARAEAAEVLRVNPSFSVEDMWRKENQPFKDDPTPILERLYAAARKAGLK